MLNCTTAIRSLILAALAVVVGACDCKHMDFVPSLPGYDAPLPSPWYSGYLSYEFEGQMVETHYILVEAEDDRHGEKPLIYWSNGGPDYEKTKIPTPIYNPYTWTRLGSILIFDQPAPVGYSYCNNETESHSCGGIAWTDELTSQAAYLALQTFYKKFPCYAEKDLYLTGESYAGIYIPTLARRIMQDENSTISLRGFAVGDGCLGTKTSICGDLSTAAFVDFWRVLFLAGHGQIPLATFQEFMRACSPMDANYVGDDKACEAIYQKVNTQAGGFYEYSLYDECTYENGLLKGGLNDYPCGEDVVMEFYLGFPQVQKALHVKGTYFSVDNAGGDFDYTATEPDLTGFYKDIHGKVRVLIYNGDADPAITSFAAQNWTSRLGFTESESWRPWTVDGCRRMGGYITRYDGDFDFLTIRGAGHMVPTYKAAATFTFMKSWIQNTDYPVYDPQCEQPFVEYHKVGTRLEDAEDK